MRPETVGIMLAYELKQGKAEGISGYRYLYVFLDASQHVLPRVNHHFAFAEHPGYYRVVETNIRPVSTKR